jgi:hypothetical protein
MFMTAAWNTQICGREDWQSAAAQPVGIPVSSRQVEIRLRILILLNMRRCRNMSLTNIMTRNLTLAAICAATLLQPAPSQAEQVAEVRVSYSNGQFQPGDVSAPADRPIVIRVKNLDAKAMEFESTSLRVEKVVAAKSEGVLNVRALKPGRYEFYDDFNEKARGALTVQ